jgi:basic membrane protein A
VQTNSGASNAGVVEAAKEAGIMCAGEITDFYDTYENFVGIIGIGFGDTIYAAIKALVDGGYSGGHGIRDLSNGGYFMDWASYERFANSNEKYGEAFKPAVEEAKKLEKQVIDGSLAIKFDAAVPNWSRISGEK